MPPQNWYSSPAVVKRTYIIRHLPSESVTTSQSKDYYTQALSGYPDVVDIGDITEFTGYNRRTVGQWCRKGRLKFVMRVPKYMIPKSYLIEHLCSEWYDQIIRKTEKHLDAIWEIYRISHNGAYSADGLK